MGEESASYKSPGEPSGCNRAHKETTTEIEGRCQAAIVRLTPDHPLVTLVLIITIPSTYFEPNALLQWISTTHIPTITPIALPNLRWFWFQGVNAYLEAVLRACLRSPSSDSDSPASLHTGSCCSTCSVRMVALRRGPGALPSIMSGSTPCFVLR